MAPRLDYTANPTYPYIPADVLKARLEARSIDAPGGCRLWVGDDKAKRPKPLGLFWVTRRSGRRCSARVHKLSWWLHHGVYPQRPDSLVRTCGNPACFAIDHLRIERRFNPTPEWPYMTREALGARLDSHTVDGDGGCRLWTGYRHSSRPTGAPIMRINSGSSTQLVGANRMAWWLAHGHYPRAPEFLTATCGNAHCMNVAHLQLRTHQDRRKLTSAQVVEARALYWTPFTRLTPSQRRMKAPSPEQLAAWNIGMSLVTLRRVLRGLPCCPAKWQGAATNPLEVRLAVERARSEHAARLADRNSVWTTLGLSRRYGVSEGRIYLAVQGFAYRHVPMPPEADKRVQRAARDALTLARERARAPAAPVGGAAEPARASPPAA